MTTNTTNTPKYSPVDARPTKQFFISMLTRDIDVEDAILDLIDNCVDGISRSSLSKLNMDKPYEGFWAEISVTGDMFMIKDNCGGIPWSEHDRAFRMGRPKIDSNAVKSPTQFSVGVYGIGMKRAIFKIGNEANIKTKHANDSYQVLMTTDWMESEDVWDLDVKSANWNTNHDGTTITIDKLHPDISEKFRPASFQSDLLKKIANHYAIILQKGFKISVNNNFAKPEPVFFRFSTENDKDAIRPYIFQGDVNGVEVFVAIGLRDPILGVDKVMEENDRVSFSSEYAGITIICNDRVVLYCNRDELTGWGTAGIPRYHTQFITISGVVEFRGDPSKLPTNTTKRGVNTNSALYYQILDRMRDGLRLFVDFTNKWKTREDEAKSKVAPIPAISFSDLKQELKKHQYSQSFKRTRTGAIGDQLKPILPMPPTEPTDIRISYMRSREQVDQLAEELIKDLEDIPTPKDIARLIGEKSFDFAWNQLFADKPKA